MSRKFLPGGFNTKQQQPVLNSSRCSTVSPHLHLVCLQRIQRSKFSDHHCWLPLIIIHQPWLLPIIVAYYSTRNNPVFGSQGAPVLSANQSQHPWGQPAPKGNLLRTLVDSQPQSVWVDNMDSKARKHDHEWSLKRRYTRYILVPFSWDSKFIYDDNHPNTTKVFFNGFFTAKPIVSKRLLFGVEVEDLHEMTRLSFCCCLGRW